MKRTVFSILLMLNLVINCFSQQQFHDTSFGNNGMSLLNTPGQSSFGKILYFNDRIYTIQIEFAESEETHYYYKIKAYTTDGVLDTSFNFDTVIEGDYWSMDDNFQGFLSSTSDNKLLMAYNRFYLPGQENMINVVKINLDGSVDTTYGTNGYTALTSTSNNLVATVLDAKKLDNDDLLVVGWNNTSVFINKFNSNGTRYTNIWNNGIITYNFTHRFRGAVQSIHSATDNSIYLLLNNRDIFTGTLISAKIVKLNMASGLPDQSFGNNGELYFNDALRCMTLTPDNKLLVISSNETQCNLRKFTNSGTTDLNFAGGQPVQIDNANFWTVRNIKYENDKIIILREKDYGDGFIFQRLNSDGSTDNSFGVSGKIIRDQIATNGVYFIAYDFVTLGNRIITSGGYSENVQTSSLSASLFGLFTTPQTANYTAPKSETIILYPNPSSDTVFIKSSTAVSRTEIYNTIGQLVTKANVINNRIDVSTLCTGTYIVKLYTSDNTQHTQKLIKK